MSNTPTSNTRVFRNAGTMQLIRHLNDGSNSKSPQDIYTTGRGVVDSMTTTYSASTSDMNDGNSLWPAASYTDSISATVAAVLNTVDPNLYCFVTGAKKVVQNNEPFGVVNEKQVIGSDSKVRLCSRLSTHTPVLVRGSFDNCDLTLVSAEPSATGEFKVDYDTGELTFHADDAGKIVFLTYDFIAAEAISYQLPAVPRRDTFTVKIFGKTYDKDETDAMLENYIIDCAKVTGDIALPPRQKAIASWTITFTITSPRGENAIEWKMSKAPDESEPILPLTVVSKAGATSGKTTLTVTPTKSVANGYKYKTAATLVLPAFAEILGSDWIAWDGTAEISATTGQRIAVAEVDGQGRAQKIGDCSVISKV